MQSTERKKQGNRLMISNGKKNTGISIAEYALIFALVAIVAIPALSILGDAIASGLRDNEPTSKADALFALLGGSGANTGAGTEVVAGMGTSPPKGQPLSNVLFNYNAQTGMVEVALPDGSSAGGMTTSADGTKVLAQNLADLADDSSLTPEQQQRTRELSSLAFKIAAEEAKILADYPELAEGKNVDIVAFFSGAGKEYYLWDYYQQFNKVYNDLGLPSGAGNPVEQVIETNAALVSQLAYENFIEMQAKPENGAAAGRDSQAEASKIVGDVDIGKITVEETPPETQKAGQELEDSGV